MYREANGLFEQVRYLMLIRAAINIVLSVVLGKIWGTFGILLATAISLIATNFWYEPGILFKKVFEVSVFDYWTKQIKYFLATVVGLIIAYYSIRHIPDGMVTLLIKAIIIVISVSLPFLAVSCKSTEFKTAASFLKIRKK